jgi:hypothetical protein
MTKQLKQDWEFFEKITVRESNKLKTSSKNRGILQNHLSELLGSSEHVNTGAFLFFYIFSGTLIPKSHKPFCIVCEKAFVSLI